MYSQSLIDTIGEKWARDVLDGRKSYHFDINNINESDQQAYYCFQHFLVKACLNGYNKQACSKFLNQMYDDFSKKPFLFYNSPLLGNKTIERFIVSDKQKDIKDFRDNYYSNKEFSRLLQMDRSRMSDEDKRKFYAILLTKLREKNNKYKDIIKKEIEYIINSDFKSLTRMQLTFYAQYVSDWANRNSKVHTVAKVGKNQPTLRGRCSGDYVFINQRAFDSIAIMTKTICHENRHAIQFYDAKNGNKTLGYEMAVSTLFARYLNTEKYDHYHTNYQYSDIELDAETSGYSEASLFFYEFNRKDLLDEVIQERKKRLDKRNYYANIKNEQGGHDYIENYIIEQLSMIISKHPEELENFPVLKNFYLPNGQRKSFYEILSNRIGQEADYRKMYDNYIDYGICHGELDKININKMKPEELKNFFDMIYWTYFRNINLFLDYYRDTPNNGGDNYKKQIEMTSKHALYPVYKELKYLTENYDLFVQKLGYENIAQTLQLTINYIRELTDEKLENQIIKNSPEARQALNLTKGKLLELNQKVNESYIQERVNEMPEEVLNAMITIPGFETMSFKNFLKYKLPECATSFNHFVINGQSYSRSEFIDYYSKIIKDSSIEEEEHKKSK